MVRALYRSEAKRDAVADIFRNYHQEPSSLLARIEWVKADVLDLPALEDAFVGVTQVYHCAASVSFIPKEEEHMHKVNVEGTVNVLNLCSDNPNIRVCHVSSVAAIGRDGSEKMISENNEWKSGKYNSAYAVSKYEAEMEVWRATVEGLNAFVVSPSLIIGPGDWSQSTGAMFKRAWKGLPFYTRGGNCFVDVRDVAQAMVLLMESGVRNERFIIGAENVLFKDFFAKVATRMGKQPPRIEATPLLTELTWRVEKVLSAITGKKPFITKETAHHAVQLNRYDNSKLLNQLPGFSFTSLDESIELVCASFLRDHGITVSRQD
jgi:nucleoside-diphosphate-sugar epimerase